MILVSDLDNFEQQRYFQPFTKQFDYFITIDSFLCELLFNLFQLTAKQLRILFYVYPKLCKMFRCQKQVVSRDVFIMAC